MVLKATRGSSSARPHKLQLCAFLVVLTWSPPSVLMAQDVDAGVAADAGGVVDAETQGASEKAAQPNQEQTQTVPLSPPRLVAIDAPTIAESIERLELLIEVRADGSVILLECSYSANTCVAVHDVLQAAHIEPAMRDGVAITARVPLHLQTKVPPAADALSPPPREREQSALQKLPAGEFRARGQVEKQQGERAFELRELRDVPGAFGDPFRAITALPGVVTVLSGVPYVYVRGAPPAGNAFFYDDIPVPALFHLGLGPAVIHPRAVGDVKLFPAAAPARYGRLTGAVVRGLGPEKPGAETIGEIDLRLLDVNAFVATRVGDATVQMAGRYGYPGLLLSIFSPEASLAYWDYQARAWYPVDEDHEVSFVWFGSFDSLGEIDDGEEKNLATLEFHRGELRHTYRDGDLTLLTAAMLGYERSSIEDNEVAVNAFRLRPRFVAKNRFSSAVSIEVGADYQLTTGQIEGRNAAGEADGDDLGITGSYLAAADWRMASGLYGMVQLNLSPLRLDLGARADLWATNLHTDLAPSLRARAAYELQSGIELRAGAALNYQPATFILPLPGFSDVALDQGLQRSIQTEFGIATTLPEIEVELTGFVNHYNKMLFPDLFIEKSLACDEGSDGCEDFSGAIPRADGLAYGLELFARRPISEAVSGWVAYTLGAATATTDDGFSFPTEADVRHNLNVVAQLDIGNGFAASIRLFARSGKPETRILGPLQLTRRLPGFYRIDASVAYSWKTGWGNFRLALEWFNITMSQEPLGFVCNGASFFADENVHPSERCDDNDVGYAPAIFFPSLSLRATF